MSVYFEYKNIKDYVYITEYNPITHMLSISFPNIITDKIFTIHSDNFKSVKFGNFIDEEINYGYKYNIGDVIDCNMGIVTILDRQTIFVGSDKNVKRKAYYIECNLCHNKRWIEATDINKENHQFCDKCGIHTYYPEKFVKNLLDQFNVKYISQFNKRHNEWCKNFYYDFYIELKDRRIIIETNGNQHYSKIWTNSKHTIEEIQQNDLLKRNNALYNGITDYFIIDCRYSNKDWIKQSIKNSNLLNSLEINENFVDWNKCDNFATSDYVRISANLFNEDNTIEDICHILNKSRNTITKYLKKAYDLCLCSYPFSDNYIIEVYKNNEKIHIFNNMTETERYMKSVYHIPFTESKVKRNIEDGIEYHGFVFKIVMKGYAYENTK